MLLQFIIKITASSITASYIQIVGATYFANTDYCNLKSNLLFSNGTSSLAVGCEAHIQTTSRTPVPWPTSQL